MQEAGSNGVLHITLRSSVRGMDGLIISIPTWDLDNDSLTDETVSSGSATITTVSESECEDFFISHSLPKISIDIIKRSDLPCNDCPICLEPFKLRQHAKQLPCQHMFHKKCIDKWLNRSHLCPCCRNDITTNMESIEMHHNVTTFRLRPMV